MSRPSRQERKIIQAFQGVDPMVRTRGSAAVARKVQEGGVELERMLHAKRRVRRPRKLVLGGKAIYSGNWRGFTRGFAKKWWDAQELPWRCYRCKRPKNIENADIIEKSERSIDHKTSFSEMKLQVETLKVCHDGIHWEVALTKDVLEIIQDEENLAPMHKGCNSSKSGSKDTDSIAPKRLKGKAATCLGPIDCKLLKAE